MSARLGLSSAWPGAEKNLLRETIKTCQTFRSKGSRLLMRDSGHRPRADASNVSFVAGDNY